MCINTNINLAIDTNVRYILNNKWNGVYGRYLLNYCLNTTNCIINIIASTNYPTPN